MPHVLCADVAVPELRRLDEGEVEDSPRPRIEGRRAWGRYLTGADRLSQLFAHGRARDAERFERHGSKPVSLVDQPEEDVLGTDGDAVQSPRLFLRKKQRSARWIGEPLEHHPSIAFRAAIVSGCEGRPERGATRRASTAAGRRV